MDCVVGMEEAPDAGVTDLSLVDFHAVVLGALVLAEGIREGEYAEASDSLSPKSNLSVSTGANAGFTT